MRYLKNSWVILTANDIPFAKHAALGSTPIMMRGLRKMQKWGALFFPFLPATSLGDQEQTGAQACMAGVVLRRNQGPLQHESSPSQVKQNK